MKSYIVKLSTSKPGPAVMVLVRSATSLIDAGQQAIRAATKRGCDSISVLSVKSAEHDWEC